MSLGPGGFEVGYQDRLLRLRAQIKTWNAVPETVSLRQCPIKRVLGLGIVSLLALQLYPETHAALKRKTAETAQLLNYACTEGYATGILRGLGLRV